jgi:hypothetical protein
LKRQIEAGHGKLDQYQNSEVRAKIMQAGLFEERPCEDTIPLRVVISDIAR